MGSDKEKLFLQCSTVTQVFPGKTGVTVDHDKNEFSLGALPYIISLFEKITLEQWCVCDCVCVCVSVNRWWLYEYMHTYSYMGMYTKKCNKHTYVWVYISAEYIYPHTHTHTQSYTYTCTHPRIIDSLCCQSVWASVASLCERAVRLCSRICTHTHTH